MCTREVLPHEANREKACDGSKPKPSTPRKIGAVFKSSGQPQRHSAENEQVVKIVTNRFQPASEVGRLQLDARDLAITAIQNASPDRQDSTDKHVPVSAERKVVA